MQSIKEATFSVADLKQLLTERVGWVEPEEGAAPTATFAELGLDSLAVLELQGTLTDRFGFELPEQDFARITLVDVVSYVSERLGRGA